MRLVAERVEGRRKRVSTILARRLPTSDTDQLEPEPREARAPRHDRADRNDRRSDS